MKRKVAAGEGAATVPHGYDQTASHPSQSDAGSDMLHQGSIVATHEIRQGDAGDLSGLAASSIDLIVTSPPYWLRRDYGHPRQLGQEATPEAYIEALLHIVDSWVPLLRPHASVFLNLGDTYHKGFLVGIPARFELAARRSGWHVVNHIIWAKSVGRPEPVTYRLASRHESVFHLTRADNASDIYFDPYALACDRGKAANPGDLWSEAEGDDTVVDDLWRLPSTRSKSGHIAPFPPELARRAILLACPERLCTACGTPHRRRLEPTAALDPERSQARRAMALFQQSGLTDDHLAAIRAVGISDAGQGKQIQKGSGRNATHVQRLADEAKEALGGYFREFTFGPKRMVGWTTCGCTMPTTPGTVLDPFMGSGTTLGVAREVGRHSIGVDLIVPDKGQKGQ